MCLDCAVTDKNLRIAARRSSYSGNSIWLQQQQEKKERHDKVVLWRFLTRMVDDILQPIGAPLPVHASLTSLLEVFVPRLQERAKEQTVLERGNDGHIIGLQHSKVTRLHK
jgi:hypothetical protein